MASSTSNVKIGVCKVLFDNVDLGYTQGGVEVSVTSTTRKVEIDQFGKTPIAETIQGREVKVKVPLAETTLENLALVFPGATLVTNPDSSKRVDVTDGVAEGANLLTLAKELRLHPISKPDSDDSEDFVIPKAATPGGLQFAYKIDAERIYNVEFTGYPDPTTRKLFFIGSAA